MLELRSSTDPSWLDCVFGDFNSFLIDHAACERKAAATGMAFVARFPEHPRLVQPMVEFAREELGHFELVWRLMQERGLTAPRDTKDEYANSLRNEARRLTSVPLLGQLLVAGVIEARSCERLKLVAERLESLGETSLGEVYWDLARAEARHHGLFFRLARELCGEIPAREVALALLGAEEQIIGAMAVTARVH